jgi:hypothetical protein
MTDREPPKPVQISLGEMRFVPELTAPPKSIQWKKIGEGLAPVRSTTLTTTGALRFARRTTWTRRS